MPILCRDEAAMEEYREFVMVREKRLKKYRKCFRIITLKIAFIFLFSPDGEAKTFLKFQSNTAPSKKIKSLQQFEGKRKTADSVSVIDLGPILILPPSEKQDGQVKFGSPQKELHKLNQERMEILRTLKRLEEKMQKRKKRKKRPTRRPCV